MHHIIYMYIYTHIHIPKVRQPIIVTQGGRLYDYITAHTIIVVDVFEVVRLKHHRHRQQQNNINSSTTTNNNNNNSNQ